VADTVGVIDADVAARARPLPPPLPLEVLETDAPASVSAPPAVVHLTSIDTDEGVLFHVESRGEPPFATYSWWQAHAEAERRGGNPKRHQWDRMRGYTGDQPDDVPEPLYTKGAKPLTIAPPEPATEAEPKPATEPEPAEPEPAAEPGYRYHAWTQAEEQLILTDPRPARELGALIGVSPRAVLVKRHLLKRKRSRDAAAAASASSGRPASANGSAKAHKPRAEALTREIALREAADPPGLAEPAKLLLAAARHLDQARTHADTAEAEFELALENMLRASLLAA
jgi:hypothetical protein